MSEGTPNPEKKEEEEERVDKEEETPIIDEVPWKETPPYRGFQSFSHCRNPELLRNSTKYASSEEYFKELRSWLQQAYFWHSVTAAFPYYLMSQQPFTNSAPNTTTNVNNGQQNATPGTATPNSARQNVQRDQGAPDGLECTIPPFWKRIVAEIFDFLILFFLKLGATYVALDLLDIVDLEKLLMFQKDANFEYKSILKMTEGIVILELLHRIVVCLFETIWLKGGVNGRIGGASPGKSFMKLRVVRCDSVTPLFNEDNNDQGIVIVRPGTDLGYGVSFLRAAVKNFILAVFIPTSFAFFYSRNNRTGYDMICSTIVIEEPIRVHRTHQD